MNSWNYKVNFESINSTLLSRDLTIFSTPSPLTKDDLSKIIDNLSEEMKDTLKIYIPKSGEAVTDIKAYILSQDDADLPNLARLIAKYDKSPAKEQKANENDIDFIKNHVLKDIDHPTNLANKSKVVIESPLIIFNGAIIGLIREDNQVSIMREGQPISIPITDFEHLDNLDKLMPIIGIATEGELKTRYRFMSIIKDYKLFQDEFFKKYEPLPEREEKLTGEDGKGRYYVPSEEELSNYNNHGELYAGNPESDFIRSVNSRAGHFPSNGLNSEAVLKIAGKYKLLESDIEIEIESLARKIFDLDNPSTPVNIAFEEFLECLNITEDQKTSILKGGNAPQSLGSVPIAYLNESFKCIDLNMLSSNVDYFYENTSDEYKVTINTNLPILAKGIFITMENGSLELLELSEGMEKLSELTDSLVASKGTRVIDKNNMVTTPECSVSINQKLHDYLSELNTVVDELNTCELKNANYDKFINKYSVNDEQTAILSILMFRNINFDREMPRSVIMANLPSNMLQSIAKADLMPEWFNNNMYPHSESLRLLVKQCSDTPAIYEDSTYDEFPELLREDLRSEDLNQSVVEIFTDKFRPELKSFQLRNRYDATREEKILELIAASNVKKFFRSLSDEHQTELAKSISEQLRPNVFVAFILGVGALLKGIASIVNLYAKKHKEDTPNTKFSDITPEAPSSDQFNKPPVEKEVTPSQGKDTKNVKGRSIK